MELRRLGEGLRLVGLICALGLFDLEPELMVEGGLNVGFSETLFRSLVGSSRGGRGGIRRLADVRGKEAGGVAGDEVLRSVRGGRWNGSILPWTVLWVLELEVLSVNSVNSPCTSFNWSHVRIGSRANWTRG